MLLTWDAPAEDAESVTGYQIKRRDPDFRRYLRMLVENTFTTATTYIDTTVRNGRRYVYRVLALRGEEVSAESAHALRRYSIPPTATPTPTPTFTPSPTPPINCDCDCNLYAHGNAYAYPNGNRNCHVYTHGNCDRNSNTDTDTPQCR